MSDKSIDEIEKEKARQIEQAKQEWEATVDSLSQLVCLLDRQGYILRANRTVEHWNLARVVEVKGQDLHDLLHPSCRDHTCYLKTFCAEAWQKLIKHKPAEYEAEDQILNRYLQFQLKPISNETTRRDKAAASFAVAIVQDITERKQVEEALRQARAELEIRVRERTAELSDINQQLEQDIAERKRVEAALARRAREMAALYESSLEISTQQNGSTLLDSIVRQAASLLGCPAAELFLAHADGQILELAAAHNQPESRLGSTIHLGAGLTGQIAQTGAPVMADDHHLADELTTRSDVIRRILGVPLKRGGRVMGVLNVLDERVDTVEQQEELRLLSLFAAQAATAIENARLHQETHKHAYQLQQILDTVQEGILLLDSEYRVKLANPAAQTYLNLLAADCFENAITHLGDQPLAEILAEPNRQQWHRVTLADPERVFETTAQPMGIGTETEGWVMILRDITAERSLQERIQQQDRLAAVGQLAAGIAHDFNNILTSIIGFTELTYLEANLPRSVKENLRHVIEQGERAAHLVRQILDFSRRSVIKKQRVELVPFLDNMINLLRRTLPEIIEITLDIKPDCRGCIIHADPTQIQQALTNLALNARDALPEGGLLRFQLSQLKLKTLDPPPSPQLAPGDWVVLSVSDTGLGIEADVLPHIFEPFFTTKEVGQGTGLGLAQVYGIIKQHEGEIEVESQPGQGTTFIFYLPALITPSENFTYSPQPNMLQGKGEVILLVEDNANVLDVTRMMLTQLGYQVLAATNGQAGLKIYNQRAGEISLVLTDMMMPAMGGVKLSQALHDRDPAIKIVVMTGYPLENEAKALLSRGIVDWIQKPLSMNKLAQTINRVLAP